MLFTVQVTHRELAVYEVEAADPEQARRRYRSSGVRVSVEPGEDEINDVVGVDLAPATVEDVRRELARLGLATKLLTTRGRPCIVVFTDPQCRRTVDTVWAANEMDGWLWGPSYQHSCRAQASAREVAHQISTTLPKE